MSNQKCSSTASSPMMTMHNHMQHQRLIGRSHKANKYTVLSCNNLTRTTEGKIEGKEGEGGKEKKKKKEEK